MASSVQPKVQVQAAAAVTVTSTALLIAPVASTTVTMRLLRLVLSGDTAGVYQLQDGSGGTTIAAAALAVNTPVTFDFTLPNGLDLGIGPNGGNVAKAGKPLTSGNSLYCVGPSGGKATITCMAVEE